MEAIAISSQGNHTEAVIGECLDLLEGQLTRTDPGRWRLMPQGDDDTSVLITLDADWLIVERVLSDGDISRIPSSMPRVWPQLNPPFPMLSGARAVLPATGLVMWIRADIPIPHKYEDAVGQLPGRIGMACAEFAYLPDGEAAAVAYSDARAMGDSSVPLQQDIRDLCDQAGWSAVVRDNSGQVAITLPNRGGGDCLALATPRCGGVTVRVDLGTVAGKGVSPACRAAAAVLLLRTAGSVRLVKARVGSSKQGMKTSLEVCLQSPIEVGMVDQALSALICAHQQVGLELEALARDHALANAYLALQGVHCGEREQ